MKILNKEELDKAIESIGKRAGILTKDIHTAGVSALAHLDEHGDIGPVNRLTLAVGKTGLRRNALASWFLAFGAVAANGDKKTKDERPFVTDKAKVTDIAGASSNPWHEFTHEPEIEELFDAQAAITKALKGIMSRAKKATTVAHPEAIEAVAKALAALEEKAAA